MLQTLKQMGITPITVTNIKLRLDSLKTLQYKANEVMYPHFNSVLSLDETRALKEQIKLICEDIKKLNETRETQEVIRQLLDIIKALRTYIANYRFDDGDVEKVQKLINYRLACYIKDKKDNNLTDDRILYHLKNIKRLYDSGFLATSTYKLKPFVSMHKELLEEFNNRYGIS